MRTLDRLLSLLAGLAFLLLLIVFLWPAGDTHLLEQSLEYLRGGFLRAFLACAIMAILAGYLLWMGFRHRRPIKTILFETALGEVRIAEQAVENLAVRAARRVRGVHDASIKVRASSAGLEIGVETIVGPDLNIPEISREIKNKVGEYIRETVGVAPVDVVVLVKKVPENKVRVE